MGSWNVMCCDKPCGTRTCLHYKYQTVPSRLYRIFTITKGFKGWGGGASKTEDSFYGEIVLSDLAESNKFVKKFTFLWFPLQICLNGNATVKTETRVPGKCFGGSLKPSKRVWLQLAIR
ncbi:MAG: hypothetical protein ACUZ8H_13490 [Candidatus Anammoxibacter sp.]